MNVGIITFSKTGYLLGEKLQGYFSRQGDATTLTRCKNKELSLWTEEHFSSDDALVFVGSCAIAVRAIATHVRSKMNDPAVIVLDERGTYVIPLLSGHVGGANALAIKVANSIEAIPVITTATDINGVFAIDSWAKREGIGISNPDRIKWVSARLLAGGTVRVKSRFPVTGDLPSGLTIADDAYDVIITHRTRCRAESLRLIPPVITLGIGSRKHVGAEDIERAFVLMLKKAGCDPLSVHQVCSIDMKADEPGILEFCHRHKLPFHTFPAQELMGVRGSFTASEFVASVTGVDNVCERSAVLGSGEGGRLLAGKDANNGITMALSIQPFTVRFDTRG